MQIETEKLIIKPLSPGELKLYILQGGELEKHLGLLPAAREVPDNVRNAITQKILPVIDNPDRNFLFHTFWTVISKAHNTMVADICFKGEPDMHNEVEIGYGTYSPFQNFGIMSETVKLMVNWAFYQGINAVIAETDPYNISSHKVLLKNNFSLESESPYNLRWRRAKLPVLKSTK